MHDDVYLGENKSLGFFATVTGSMSASLYLMPLYCFTLFCVQLELCERKHVSNDDHEEDRISSDTFLIGHGYI